MTELMSKARLAEIFRGPDYDECDEMDMLEIQNHRVDELVAEVTRCWRVMGEQAQEIDGNAELYRRRGEEIQSLRSEVQRCEGDEV